MSNETEDEITEEVVLTRWDKIKQWIEIVVATKKVAMLIWSLVFATGTAVIVGEATDTKPIRDGAVAIGLLDERVPVNSGAQPWIDELLNLQEEVGELQDGQKALKALVASIEAQMLNHTHKATYASHTHDPVEHEHSPPDMSHDHPVVAPVLVKHDHEPDTHDHPPPVHEHATNITEQELAGQLAIDGAVLLHIKNDH